MGPDERLRVLLSRRRPCMDAITWGFDMSAITEGSPSDVIAKGREICAPCPVKEICASDGRTFRATSGMWGGLASRAIGAGELAKGDLEEWKAGRAIHSSDVGKVSNGSRAGTDEPLSA